MARARHAVGTPIGDDADMRPHHLALRPYSAVLAGVLALTLVAGCDQVSSVLPAARPPAFQGQTAPAIQLGSGTTSAGPWTGWLYPTAPGSCIVVIENGKRGEPSCSFGSEPFNGDIGIGVSFGETGTMAAGSTLHETADVAVITLGTGEVVRVPVVRPGGPVANGYGYLMARFEAGTEITLIVLLDASGNELESYPFGT